MKAFTQLSQDVAALKQGNNTSSSPTPKTLTTVTPEKDNPDKLLDSQPDLYQTIISMNQKIDQMNKNQEATIDRIVKKTVSDCFTGLAENVVDTACRRTLRILSDKESIQVSDISNDDMSKSDSSKSSKESLTKPITQTPPKPTRIASKTPAPKKIIKTNPKKILIPNDITTRLTRTQSKLKPLR